MPLHVGQATSLTSFMFFRWHSTQHELFVLFYKWLGCPVLVYCMYVFTSSTIFTFSYCAVLWSTIYCIWKCFMKKYHWILLLGWRPIGDQSIVYPTSHAMTPENNTSSPCNRLSISGIHRWMDFIDACCLHIKYHSY